MMHLTSRLLISIALIAFLLVRPMPAQEKIRKTETVSTVPQKVEGRIREAGTIKGEVRCDAVFTLTQVAADGTLTGFLTIVFPEGSRKHLGEVLGKPDIPPSVAAKDINTKLTPRTHCPDIRLAVPEISIEVLGSTLHFDQTVVHLAEGHERLSRALCIWTERISKGRNNTSLVPYINLLLKGDDEEPSVKKPG